MWSCSRDRWCLRKHCLLHHRRLGPPPAPDRCRGAAAGRGCLCRVPPSGTASLAGVGREAPAPRQPVPRLGPKHVGECPSRPHAPRRAGLPHSPARCPLTSRACPLLSFRSLAGDATVPRQLPGLACSTSGSATPCRLGRVPGRSRDSQGPVTGRGGPQWHPGPRVLPGHLLQLLRGPRPSRGTPQTTLRSGTPCAHARGPPTPGPPGRPTTPPF